MEKLVYLEPGEKEPFEFITFFKYRRVFKNRISKSVVPQPLRSNASLDVALNKLAQFKEARICEMQEFKDRYADNVFWVIVEKRKNEEKFYTGHNFSKVFNDEKSIEPEFSKDKKTCLFYKSKQTAYEDMAFISQRFGGKYNIQVAECYVLGVENDFLLPNVIVLCHNNLTGEYNFLKKIDDSGRLRYTKNIDKALSTTSMDSYSLYDKLKKEHPNITFAFGIKNEGMTIGDVLNGRKAWVNVFQTVMKLK